MPSKTKDKSPGLIFVKAGSINDLCRYAYNFDFTSENLLLSKWKGKHRLILFGEQMKDGILAYYTETEKKAVMIQYVSPSNGTSESVAFLDAASNQDSNCINVVELDLSLLEEHKAKPGAVIEIRMGGIADLARAVIKKASKDGSMTHLYTFNHAGKHIVCGMDMIEALNDDKRMLYYAVSDEKPAEFIKYDYIRNTVDFSSSVGEHSYMYVKVINLAEPFSFFSGKQSQ